MSEQDAVTGATNLDETQLEALREGIDDPVVLKQQLAKEAEARRQLTARAKTAEQEKRDALTKLAELESKNITPNNVPSMDSKPLEINDEVVDLRLDGYSKDEVAWIMQNGGRKALEDKTSYTSIAINAKREQQRAEQAASQVTDTSGQSEIERKYTKEQLANMSVKELEAILPRNS
jgi:hypothetical protein